ncbi:FadR/GntR family transcriptional regulator, partial [Saccharicrinis fermentans]
AVQQAAVRRTDEDIAAIQEALDKYNVRVDRGLPAENEDFIFHLRVAEASHNSVIKTMLLIILPDILKIYIAEKVCDKERKAKRVMQHEGILQAIIDGDGDLAEKHMIDHLHDVLEFSKK